MNGTLLLLCAALLATIGLWLREGKRRRAAEADLGRVRHEVEQRRHDYLRSFAHDLRNPLSAVVMITDLLAEEEDPDQIRAQMGRVRLQATGMVELIRRYVELSALDAERYPVGRLPLDLKELLEERAAAFEEQAARKGQRLKLEVSGEVGVLGDPEACGRVLDQLLDNAIKFSPRNSLLRAGVALHPGWGEAWIEDAGPGFTEEDHLRLFLPCVPLSARPTAGESSAGLGLCIAKRLVDLTQGRIEVPVGRGPLRVFWPR